MQSDPIRTANNAGVRHFFLHDSAELVVIGSTAAILFWHVVAEEAVLACF